MYLNLIEWWLVLWGWFNVVLFGVLELNIFGLGLLGVVMWGW